MGRIRLGSQQVDPPGVVEFVHEVRIAAKPLDCRHFLQIVFGPEAVHVAKRAEPGFGGNPRPGQDDDGLNLSQLLKKNMHQELLAHSHFKV